MDISQIVVIGAGTMGRGIAQLAALAGYTTILYDLAEEPLEKAKTAIIQNLDKGIEKGKISHEQKTNALSLLTYSSNFSLLKGNLIIEAIVEIPEVKTKLFNELAAQNSADTIFATNTSSIPITKIAASIDHPERVVGMHFFNPAHIMKLVEVISGEATRQKVADTIKAVAIKMGKVPVMANDSPGFIVNRVARHFYVESLKVLEEQVASHETIDELMEASGFKMGPFKLMDLIGIDVNFSVTNAMFKSFHYDEKFRPNRIQEQKVLAGHHGKKSGKGFYNYS